MKILYLPAYFYPEQAASAYLSDNRNQAFADAGFDMVVYTPVPTRGISIEERKKYKHRKADSMYGGRMIVYRSDSACVTLQSVVHPTILLGMFCPGGSAMRCNVYFQHTTYPRSNGCID